MPRKPHPVPAHLLAILRGAQIRGNALRITTPLEAGDYLGVKQFIERAGGQWSPDVLAHVFPEGGLAAMFASLEPRKLRALDNAAARLLADL